MNKEILCRGCLKREEEIYRLKEENKYLKDRLRRQDRKITEGPFGSSTPSSKIPIKENSKITGEQKDGGAKKGHKGYGRSSISDKEADAIIEVETEEHLCPDCLENLINNGNEERTVIDLNLPEVKKIIYKLKRSRCPKCGRTFLAKAPNVLPKFLLSNKFLAYIATEHYLHGTTIGKLEEKTGVNKGSLINALHTLGELFKDVPEKLIETYRQSPVKHADETSWRNDGLNGYAWLFCTHDTSIFRIRKSRSGKIPQEVFGTQSLPGVLVVDRYNGYNQSPCEIQYCYAHLSRNIKDLLKDFPRNKEVQLFVDTSIPLLAKAMKLHSQKIPFKDYKIQAEKIKSKIIEVMNSQANHPGIQSMQNVFRENEHRLYHWADNPKIPPDNNYCERELRDLVIARKISFGSQSDKGAKTREILMTVLFTLQKKSSGNPMEIFLNCLNKITINPETDVYKNLFTFDSS